MSSPRYFRAAEIPASATPLVEMREKRAIRRIDLHAVSLPARTFTGDFYFAHRGSDGLWIALGDIAGKGLAAAIVMAMVQEELERRFTECAQTCCDPVTTLQRLQVFLRPLLPANRFVTAVVGHLRDDGRLVIANAGHCAPVVARLDGKIESIAPTGPVVGVLDAPRWSSVTTGLGRGEALLLYSDGVIEAKSLDDEEFGFAPIAAILSSAVRRGVKAREVTGSILEEVRRHASGTREDDLTVVAVRRERWEATEARPL
jgi:phosphoserine phosphatase RsbU/P